MKISHWNWYAEQQNHDDDVIGDDGFFISFKIDFFFDDFSYFSW